MHIHESDTIENGSERTEQAKGVEIEGGGGGTGKARGAANGESFVSLAAATTAPLLILHRQSQTSFKSRGDRSRGMSRSITSCGVLIDLDPQLANWLG